MADVFISYASPDRDKAQALAGILEQRGLSVWWDRKIPVGQKFHRIILEALSSSKCVIVLWSHSSTDSDWVIDEAAEAVRRGILVPVLIEDVEIPFGFGFRQVQTSRLSGWQDASITPELEALLESVTEIIRTKTSPDSKTTDKSATAENHSTEALSAINHPIDVLSALVDEQGWVICPACGERFNSRIKFYYRDGVHMTCYRKIKLLKARA